MSRRCSHCGHNGHNCRTCLDKGFKLFGVRLSEPLPPVASSISFSSSSPSSAMRKCVSMGNLSSYGSSESASPSASHLEHPELDTTLDGYVSDDLVHTTSSARERKKGVPWTEEEHRLFLRGLQKLGKGDWRGISRNFVKTRTPTQVASHAQKYFLRRGNLNKRRRRSSLFDITPETVPNLVAQEDAALEELALEGTDVCPLIHQLNLGQHRPFGEGGGVEPAAVSRLGIPVGGYTMPLTSLPLSYIPTGVDEIMEEAGEEGDGTESVGCGVDDDSGLSGLPSAEGGTGFDNRGTLANHASLPFPWFPFWGGPAASRFYPYHDSKIVRPTPIIPTAPVQTEESLRTLEPGPVMKPSPLSYKLLEDGSRQSAFHTMSSANRTEMDTKGSLSSAISVA